MPQSLRSFAMTFRTFFFARLAAKRLDMTKLVDFALAGWAVGAYTFWFIWIIGV